LLISFAFQMLCRFLTMPAARPILLSTSLSQKPSALTTPPRYIQYPLVSLHLLFFSSNALHFSLCSVDLQLKSITSCIDFFHCVLQIIITLCNQTDVIGKTEIKYTKSGYFSTELIVLQCKCYNIQNPDTLAPNSLFSNASTITTSNSILDSIIIRPRL